MSVVPPTAALPSERSLRDQIRLWGGALFPVVAALATRWRLCEYGSM